MTIEERVIKARNNRSAESNMIEEYLPFILSCANKALGRYITREDDEFSVALSAFYEAMTKYEPDKGAFLSFARLTIKNRLTDFLRKEYRKSDEIPFSALKSEDNSDFDIAAASAESDTRYEIEELTGELKGFGLSFFDVSRGSPKTQKTKRECMSAVRYIISEKSLVEAIKMKKYIPAAQISAESGVKPKILERHRSYIIAAVLIMTGEYPSIQEYFPKLKEVSQ